MTSMRVSSVLLFLLPIFIFSVGCGKRTTPIPLTSFNVDPQQNIELERSVAGISISNNNDDYHLVIYRSELELGVQNPSNKYIKIHELLPESSFVDIDVSPGRYYEYAVVSLDKSSNTVSSPSYYRIKYSPMTYLDNVRVTSSQHNTTLLSFDLDPSIVEVNILINNEEVLVINHNTVEIRVPLSGIDSIVLTPYDIYSNPGKTYTINPSGNSRVTSQYSTITNLVLHSSENVVVLRWTPVHQATYYTVEIIHFGKTLSSSQTVSPLMRIDVSSYVDSGSCIDVKISAIRNGAILDSIEEAYCLAAS